MIYEEIIKETAVAIEEEAFKAKGAKRFIYRGRCMFPLLKEGDEMLVSFISHEQARPGDIIVYEEDSRLVVRRLLYTKTGRGKGLVMVPKADNSLRMGRPFAAGFFVGKVIEARKNGRRIINTQALLWKVVMCYLWLWSLCEGFSFALAFALKRNMFSGLRVHNSFRRQAASLLSLPRYILLNKLLRGK